MLEIIHKIPIFTTLVSVVFFIVIGKHWYGKKHHSPHLLWWTLGVAFYGAGTFAESIVTLYGWNETAFRVWYIFGALLGGAPLAQGTVYLLMKRKTADIFAVIIIALIIIATVFTLLSPVEYLHVEQHRLTGKVLAWQKVRLFAIFINTYATIFLIGGAAYSAWKYSKDKAMKYRFYGNILITIGAMLPGIGGTFTAFGYTEVLYVTESLGLMVIFSGYLVIKKDKQENGFTPLSS